MQDLSIVLDEIPSYSSHGGRLGRNVEHDIRSAAFKYVPSRRVIKSIRHACHIPRLDQLSLGSCTGNSGTHNLASDPFFMTLSTGEQSTLNQKFAVKLYSDATKVDAFTGQYPPTDTGSSGLAIGKVLQKRKTILGYQHATSLETTLNALMDGPVITGINWMSSFDKPDSEGLVKITGSAFTRGGHEICIDEVDVTKKLLGFMNSWGPTWGLDGRFYMSYDDFGTLLGQNGDVTIFAPNISPNPTPTNNPEDVALAISMRTWLTAKGL